MLSLLLLLRGDVHHRSISFLLLLLLLLLAIHSGVSMGGAGRVGIG
jgi:hypothetical protein